MILMPDLFSFAYVPNWYSQLDMLAEMALPEPWRFKNPIYLTKNPDTTRKNGYPAMQQNSSISKMSFVVSTRVFTPGDTRRSMPVSTGIKRRTLCWNGISGALRMN